MAESRKGAGDDPATALWQCTSLVPALVIQDVPGGTSPAAPGGQVPSKPLVPRDGANPALPQALADAEWVSTGSPWLFQGH